MQAPRTDSDYEMMAWAKKWVRKSGWMHRLRLMLGFDEQKVRWHYRNVKLSSLADMWKSYVAKDAMERQDTSSMSGFGPAPRP